MKLNSKIITGTAFAVLMTASAASQAAFVKQTQHGESVTVSVAELNLKSIEGQEVAYKRLQHAARKVCGATNVREAGGVGRARSNSACYDETLTEAVESLGNAGIRAMHYSS